MATTGDYFPLSPSEKLAYDELWSLAKPQDGTISGRPAVEFLQQSGIDISTLRTIWTLSCPGTSTMNVNQFYTALRYISMVQKRGIAGGVTKEVLLSTISFDFGPPKFNIPSLSSNVAPAHVIQPFPTTVATSVPPGDHKPPSSPIIDPALYAMTPSDHLKYHALFVQYDHNKDGYLSEPEAVAVLSKSGVPPDLLSYIYDMADVDHDTRLSSKEFCVAFHLILCVTKRHLPRPSSLPASLISFLEKAPVTPIAVPVSSSSSSSMPSSTASSMPSSPRSSSQPSSSSSQPLSSQPSSSSSQPSSSSIYDEIEVSSITNHIKTSVNDAMKINDTSTENMSRATSLLKQLLSKLQEQQVSLSASLSSAKKFGDDASASLDNVTREIASSTMLLMDMQQQLIKQQHSNVSVQAQLGEKQLERQLLLQKVDEMRKQVMNAAHDLTVASEQSTIISNDHATIKAHNDDLRASLHAQRAEVQGLMQETELLSSLLSSLAKDKSQLQQCVDKLKYDHGQMKLQLVTERSTYTSLQHDLHDVKQSEHHLRLQVSQLLTKIQDLSSSSSSSTSSSSSSIKDDHHHNEGRPLIISDDHHDDDGDDDDDKEASSSSSYQAMADDHDNDNDASFGFGDVYPDEKEDDHIINPSSSMPSSTSMIPSSSSASSSPMPSSSSSSKLSSPSSSPMKPSSSSTVKKDDGFASFDKEVAFPDDDGFGSSSSSSSGESSNGFADDGFGSSVSSSSSSSSSVDISFPAFPDDPVISSSSSSSSSNDSSNGFADDGFGSVSSSSSSAVADISFPAFPDDPITSSSSSSFADDGFGSSSSDKISSFPAFPEPSSLSSSSSAADVSFPAFPEDPIISSSASSSDKISSSVAVKNDDISFPAFPEPSSSSPIKPSSSSVYKISTSGFVKYDASFDVTTKDISFDGHHDKKDDDTSSASSAKMMISGFDDVTGFDDAFAAFGSSSSSSSSSSSVVDHDKMMKHDAHDDGFSSSSAVVTGFDNDDAFATTTSSSDAFASTTTTSSSSSSSNDAVNPFEANFDAW